MAGRGGSGWSATWWGTETIRNPPSVHLSQCCIRFNADPDPAVGLKTFLFLDPNIFLSLGLHEGRPSYSRSLEPFKKNILHFKACNFFLFLWIIFALLDPDPDSQCGSCRSEYESGPGSVSALSGSGLLGSS